MKSTKLVLLLCVFFSYNLLTGCSAVVVGGVATGVSVTHDRRSPEVVLNDKEIQFNAYKLLFTEAQLGDQTQISISSYNHRVLIVGRTHDIQETNAIAQHIAKMAKVRTVHNQVSNQEKDLSLEFTDSYLTSKAKLELFTININDFDPTRIKVVTSDATVYLMGIVTTAEANAVVEKIRYISGVKKVVKLFDYYQTE